VHWYDGAVVRAELDPDSGAVLVDEAPADEDWARFNHPFGDYMGMCDDRLAVIFARRDL
jgi:hypothetical protein